MTITCKLIFKNLSLCFLLGCLLSFSSTAKVQNGPDWIRPANAYSPAIWGMKNGIVFGLWPYVLESSGEAFGGGPRGLIRIGTEFKGRVYHINYIAVEPIVNKQIEFSEISPSLIDGKWGKLMWAGESEQRIEFGPYAATRGLITKPVPGREDIEELSLYVYIEKFKNGAHPYLRISIRSDRPQEICFQTFHQQGSSDMDACHLSATMGNYSRLRLLSLKDRVVDSRVLYKGFDGIDFIEKERYSADKMLKDKNGDLIVIAEPSESFAELSSWPQQDNYFARSGWRYRPFFMVSQYWRKEASFFDPSLHVRVNGRAKYWGGGGSDRSKYLSIPGGPSFENFELREKYYPGQKFYFGITRKNN